MSTYSTVVAAASTAYSGLTTPDVTVPFEPNVVRVSNPGATAVEVSFNGPAGPPAGICYPSPHPSATLAWRSPGEKVWLRNMTGGSSVSCNVFADDAGY